jgi:hypothetical protein
MIASDSFSVNDRPFGESIRLWPLSSPGVSDQVSIASFYLFLNATQQERIKFLERRIVPTLR